MAAKRFSAYAPGPLALHKGVPAAKIKAQPAAHVPPALGSNPVNIPGSASPGPRMLAPQQGGDGQLSKLLCQASDAKLGASGGRAAACEVPIVSTATARPAVLAGDPPAQGSWKARQTILPLPPRPTGFPTAETKARLQAPVQVPVRSAADVVWRYRFRRKWRREQLRALLDEPDSSPDANALQGRSLDPPDPPEEEYGMLFHIEDVPAAAAPKPQSSLLGATIHSARPPASAASAAGAVPSAPLTAPLVLPPASAAALPPPPPHLRIADMGPPAAAQQATDAPQAALAGLRPIRKAVMRGRAGGGGGRRSPVARAGLATPAMDAKAQGMKAGALLEQSWEPPEWTSPARAGQAA